MPPILRNTYGTLCYYLVVAMKSSADHEHVVNTQLLHYIIIRAELLIVCHCDGAQTMAVHKLATENNNLGPTTISFEKTSEAARTRYANDVLCLFPV